ncbi:MAG: T9SS type A sorting domain-containing protein [Bacteroidia bacterium]
MNNLLTQSGLVATTIVLLLNCGFGQSINKLPLSYHERALTVNLEKSQPHATATLRNLEGLHEHVIWGEAEYERFRENQQKRLHQPRNGTGEAGLRSAVDPPVSLIDFEANNSSNWIPNDNSIAVSFDERFLLSVSNHNIEVYDRFGQKAVSHTLADFAQTSDTIGRLFDPHTIYDPIHDRFIVVFLQGVRIGENRMIVAFSQTGDPAGNWNIYFIDTDLQPGGVSVWADFPRIAISKEELFISVNFASTPLDSTSTARIEGVGVWQIALQEGFQGTTLQSQPYTVVHDVPWPNVSNLSQLRFNIVPVKQLPVPSSDSMYFVERVYNGSAPVTGNKMNLFRISGTISSGSSLSLLNAYQLNNPFVISPSIRQKGNNDDLDSNDGRYIATYTIDSKIYFGFTAEVQQKSGFLFGEFTLVPIGPNFYSLRSYLFSMDSLEIGFPSLAYGGLTSANRNGHNHLLFFNFASPNHYPGIGAAVIDENHMMSDPVIIRESDFPLNPKFSSPRNRFGDFTELAMTGTEGSYWGAGYSVQDSNLHSTRISNVTIPSVFVGNDESGATPVGSFNTVPNPVSDQGFIDFEVVKAGEYFATIYDSQGKCISSVFRAYLQPGHARVSFSVYGFPAGVYIVALEGKETGIFRKKIVVGD